MLKFQFTDRQLSLLFLSLEKDYKTYTQENLSMDDKYDFLCSSLDYALNQDQNSSLYNLSTSDKDKAFTVLNTLFDAVQTESSRFDRRRPFKPVDFSTSRINYPHYCHHHGLFWADFFLWRPYYYPSSNNVENNSNSKQNGSVLLAIFILFILILLMFITLFALDYLFSSIQSNIERLIYNEGILQTILSMMLFAACAASVSTVIYFFLSAPITSLCLAAALANPIAVAVISLTCIGIIGTALSVGLSNTALNYGMASAYPNALIPMDTGRFNLTESESQKLVEKGIDPLKIKCAIVALYEHYDKDHDSAGASLLFWRNQQNQKIIEAVRKLRRGELVTFNLADIIDQPELNLHFNCKFDSQIYIPQAEANTIAVVEAKVIDTQEVSEFASAPPLIER